VSVPAYGNLLTYCGLRRSNEHREPLQLNLPNKGESSPNYFIYRGLAPLFPWEKEVNLPLQTQVSIYHFVILKPGYLTAELADFFLIGSFSYTLRQSSFAYLDLRMVTRLINISRSKLIFLLSVRVLE
jgi:hypothetical protein